MKLHLHDSSAHLDLNAEHPPAVPLRAIFESKHCELRSEMQRFGTMSVRRAAAGPTPTGCAARNAPSVRSDKIAQGDT